LREGSKAASRPIRRTYQNNRMGSMGVSCAGPEQERHCCSRDDVEGSARLSRCSPLQIYYFCIYLDGEHSIQNLSNMHLAHSGMLALPVDVLLEVCCSNTISNHDVKVVATGKNIVPCLRSPEVITRGHVHQIGNSPFVFDAVSLRPNHSPNTTMT
jgi:hypothetical protein